MTEFVKLLSQGKMGNVEDLKIEIVLRRAAPIYSAHNGSSNRDV